MSREVTTTERGNRGVAAKGAPLSVQQSIEDQNWRPDQTNFWSYLKHLRTNPLPGKPLAHSTGVEDSRVTRQGALVRERRTLWQVTRKGLDIWEVARPLTPQGNKMAPAGDWELDEHTQRKFAPNEVVRQGEVASAVTTANASGPATKSTTKWNQAAHVLEVLPPAVQDGLLGLLPDPTNVEATLCRYTHEGKPDTYTAVVLATTPTGLAAIQAEKGDPKGRHLDSTPWQVTQVTASFTDAAAYLDGATTRLQVRG